MYLKRCLLAITMIIVLAVFLMGCAHTGLATSRENVFAELGALATKEGVYTNGGREAYRQNGGILLAIVKMDNGGSAILEWDESGRQCYMVGYFPKNADGEYLLGIMQGQFLVYREPISKEKAEEIVRKQLDKYRAGKKTTLEEFMESKKMVISHARYPRNQALS